MYQPRSKGITRLADQEGLPLMATFEEQYEDVLQNIEFAIVSVYREHSELQDYDVEKALNALIEAYQSERQGRASGQAKFTPLAQEVYDRVRSMCEWRLGRDSLFIGNSGKKPPQPPPISLDEVVACLKRIRKSVQKWNRREGRQGYLRFVNEFIV
jgi:hypothetical protein